MFDWIVFISDVEKCYASKEDRVIIPSEI
jgi:hypothetical protein